MYSILTGHVYFRTDRHRLHPLYKHVTVFRDPIERAVSYLRFISNTEASGSDSNLANYAKYFLENEGDIPKEIIDQNSTVHALLMQGLSNIYVKHFSAYVSGELSSEHVKLAESFLSVYDYVGFNNDMPSLLKAIEEITGYRCKNQIRRVNVTPNNHGAKFVKTKKLISKLSEINTFDLALYENLLLINKKKHIDKRGRVRKFIDLFKTTPVPDLLDVTLIDELDTRGLIELISCPKQVKCNEEFTITARVENRGKTDWPGFGSPYPVLASYHWYNSNGDKVVYDGLRTTIQETIPTDSVQDIKMNVVAPNESGLFRLEATLVQECIMWFESRKFTSCSVMMEVVR